MGSFIFPYIPLFQHCVVLELSLVIFFDLSSVRLFHLYDSGYKVWLACLICCFFLLLILFFNFIHIHLICFRIGLQFQLSFLCIMLAYYGCMALLAYLTCLFMLDQVRFFSFSFSNFFFICLVEILVSSLFLFWWSFFVCAGFHDFFCLNWSIKCRY